MKVDFSFSVFSNGVTDRHWHCAVNLNNDMLWYVTYCYNNDHDEDNDDCDGDNDYHNDCHYDKDAVDGNDYVLGISYR